MLPQVLEPPTVTQVAPNPCPGYRLAFPEGQTAWSSYPFAVHSVEKIPWSIASSGKELILYSLEPPCSQVSPSANINNPQSFTSCHMLEASQPQYYYGYSTPCT